MIAIHIFMYCRLHVHDDLAVVIFFDFFFLGLISTATHLKPSESSKVKIKIWGKMTKISCRSIVTYMNNMPVNFDKHVCYLDLLFSSFFFFVSVIELFFHEENHTFNL